ncbi:MAG: carboxymuconolactone decarboxylase family protein [Halieaceae bacterium]|nr:carboxymuconolactone decarboxylase family protein [Halieaceae bacterium]
MPDSERRARGLKMIDRIYAGDVVAPDEGYPLTDVMLEQLFAETWARDVLSIRDRRLMMLGIIAEKGDTTTFGIQAKAALKNGELNEEELRELLLTIANYSGYPRAASMIGPVETAIAEVRKERGAEVTDSEVN